MTAAFSKRSFIQQMFFGLVICFILVSCVTTDSFLPEDHPLHPNNPPDSPNKEDYGKRQRNSYCKQRCGLHFRRAVRTGFHDVCKL